MKKLTTALVLMVTLLPALSGCGRVRYPAYYTLNLPAPPDPPAAENVRTSIAVREFQSPGYLRQGPIVYRTTPEEIGFTNTTGGRRTSYARDQRGRGPSPRRRSVLHGLYV